MEMLKARCSVAAVAMVLAACAEKAVVHAVADTLPIVAAPATGSATDCPATGLWAQCSVLRRLEQGGLAVHADSLTEVHDPSLSIAGKRMPIANGEIEIFLYADSGSRLRDAAKLDKKAFIDPSRQPSILRERTAVTNENLLVLMKVTNETNRERIANNLMAGPPQPPKNRPLSR
jgi:hypothetical protein